MVDEIKPGREFSRWRVLHRVEDRPNGNSMVACWMCECSCAKKTKRPVVAPALIGNKSRSCGCLRTELMRAKRQNNLIGHPPFDRLTVIGPGTRPRYWRCLCQCGKEKEIVASSLLSGMTRSCGCLRSEEAAKRKTVHGQATRKKRGAEWRAWWAIISRIQHASNHSYDRYGGRGVKMCARWMESFENFYEDMGDKPGADYSVDRENVNGHYSCGKCEECRRNNWPANCRWATRKEQGRNKTNNNNVEYQGKTQCLAAWSEEMGIPRQLLAWRIKNGWSVEAAMTVPPRTHKSAPTGEGSDPSPSEVDTSPRT